MDYKEAAKELIFTIDKCVSPFHVVQMSIEKLEEAGFTELDLGNAWNIEAGHGYYVNVFDSSIVAFTVGTESDTDANLRIATAHNDFPCLRIKPAGEIEESGYIKLNAEVYGGAILSTWMDRPLSVAGKVVVKTDNIFRPKALYFDMDRPVLTIPNLAPHINREINSGYILNKQKDMLPIMDVARKNHTADEAEKIEKNIGNAINEKGNLIKAIAEELDVAPEDIIDMELVAYQQEKGCIIGLDGSMISSPRLDNITSVVACLYGLIHSNINKGLNLIAMFDNEEIGSESKQGAGSMVLSNIIERIYLSLGYDRADYLRQVADGIIVSCDVAHGLHPNYTEKYDITTKALLNGGVVIKKDSKQKYANDAQGVAIVRELCEKAGVGCQEFANRSDAIGGSTLGSILSTSLPMRTIDVGVPVLAMHSARELMGVKDQYALNELIKALFER